MSARTHHGRHDERGVVAVVTVLAATVMLVAGALAVDLGNTWARRGNLQGQADQAALYAARYLPANDAAGRLGVAKAAAYYILCHKVYGQDEIDESMPGCPSSPTSSDAGFVAYAGRLMTDNRVTFPTIDGDSSSYVQVTTPPARVDFGFGAVAGASNTVQTRTATARVGTPGSVSPMSLSLNCLLSAAVNLPAGLGNSLTGILPLNYIAPGPITVDKVTTKWPTSQTTDNSITLAPTVPGVGTSTTQGVNPGSISISGSGWGLAGTDVDVYFAMGDVSGRAAESTGAVGTTYMYKADSLSLNLGSVVGIATVQVPPEVYNKAGVWEVKVAPKGLLSARKWSKLTFDYTVELPMVTQDLLGCARLIKTPRDQQVGTPGNLQYSLKAGLDHPIATNENIATLNMTTPLTVPSLLNDLSDAPALVSCNNQLPNVYDTGGVHPTPNCVMPEQGANTYKEFTDGILGLPDTVPADSSTHAAAYQAAGRLICTSAQPCQRVWKGVDRTWMTDRDINDDRFTDFVIPERANLLTEAMFFNLDTYLLNDLPPVTPRSALKPELYKSGRFMWVPVISSPVAPNNANYYPVLTYRPIFITQDAPSTLDSVDLVLDIVDSWVKTLLNISPDDDHGLLMDSAGTTLRAMRFMTIEPSALPAVADDYDGPISPYVGTGPRVVRLVR